MSNLYVYLMRSRNKDNKDIIGFKERKRVILEYKENECDIIQKFYNFAEKGVDGETSRLYRSVNSRNEDKVREAFIIRLLKDKPSVTKLNAVLASVAQDVANRDESKWLFDFDVDDKDEVNNFISDINFISGIPFTGIQKYKTPNGYAVICEHGFDTRWLMEKWKDYDISLHKDRLLYLQSHIKPSIAVFA